MRFLEWSDSERQEVEWQLPGAGEVGNGELVCNTQSFSLGTWMMVMVAQRYEST